MNTPTNDPMGDLIRKIIPSYNPTRYGKDPTPMKTLTEPTYQIRLYLSGPIEVAKQVIREHVLAHPQCVTVEPTTFLYTGGEEQGYVVGLLNYPRFPSTQEDLCEYAMTLARLLLDRTFQHSALVVGSGSTVWITKREEK